MSSKDDKKIQLLVDQITNRVSALVSPKVQAMVASTPDATLSTPAVASTSDATKSEVATYRSQVRAALLAEFKKD